MVDEAVGIVGLGGFDHGKITGLAIHIALSPVRNSEGELRNKRSFKFLHSNCVDIERVSMLRVIEKSVNY